MNRRRSDPLARWTCVASSILFAASIVAARANGNRLPQAPASAPASSPAAANSPSKSETPPRPKKLVLKDGSFQLVREYQVNGDRVRYYSVESSQWEEIPADLIDWDATKKAESETLQREAAILAAARKREEQRRAEVLDIDASIEVAPKVFLPPGEGIFAYDGQTMQQLAQAESTSRLSKGKAIEKVLVPIPITPTRYNISIKGEHATIRVRGGTPEFYVRTTATAMPEVGLFRAKIQNGNRGIEHLDEIFGQQGLSGKRIDVQVWPIAQGVYRFTPRDELGPGEYALVQVVSAEPVRILLWDFGISAPISHVAH